MQPEGGFIKSGKNSHAGESEDGGAAVPVTGTSLLPTSSSSEGSKKNGDSLVPPLVLTGPLSDSPKPENIPPGLIPGLTPPDTGPDLVVRPGDIVSFPDPLGLGVTLPPPVGVTQPTIVRDFHEVLNNKGVPIGPVVLTADLPIDNPPIVSNPVDPASGHVKTIDPLLIVKGRKD